MNSLACHLMNVEKPARYTGGEYNAIVKEWQGTPVRVALAFPDIYEVGMGHLGSKILYWIINQRQDALCERVYAPWSDMESVLRAEGIKLFSLESKRPVSSFDLVGFSLQYELSYTNVLNMLNLSGVPLRSTQRGQGQPFVIGGGPGAFNPEPVADFFDLFFLGEAEEGIHEILDILRSWKESGGSREEFLLEAAKLPGVYVPRYYDIHYEGPKVVSIEPKGSVPPKVTKRIVFDLEGAEFPERFVVPYLDVVHDRVMVEVFRGCTRGCRFCQAGMIYRPVRERTPQTLREQVRKLISSTGYEEVSLTSLSTGDYSRIEQLVDELAADCSPCEVAVSLPSLRVDSFSVGIANRLQSSRRTGLTFAPEAGTQRLRNVINKNVTDDDLYAAARSAFEAGWDAIKLYFMIGLPTETDEDVRGIAELAKRVAALGREVRGKAGKAGRVKVTVSTSSFVPKAHTPFQWDAQDTPLELKRKQELLRSELKDRAITYNWHDTQTSLLEAVFSRGDRRVGTLLERAWQLGCRFDGWSEHFDFEKWQRAMKETGVFPDDYAHRTRDYGEILPWDHLQPGLSKNFLIAERERALRGEPTSDCREGCVGCGVCTALGAEMLVGERP